MKNKTAFLFLLLFSFVSISSQNVGQLGIELKISNIPDIEFKTMTGLKSYRIDKSETISYVTKSNHKKTVLDIDTTTYEISKLIDEDTIFLKLRYNPGKKKVFILRRGDQAKIDYIFGIPYLEVTNRTFKKHDVDVISAIDELLDKEKNRILSLNIHFFNDKKAQEKEKQKIIKEYNNILNSLDSLHKNDFLSFAEYEYYSKMITYKKSITQNKFDIELLKKKDLHIEPYDLYLRQYVFKNLKKKIISLGNGMARNSLEAFDVVLKSNEFSTKNKKYLLTNYLKNIRIDFPKLIYNNRLEKYTTLYNEKITEEVFKKDFDNILELSKTVELVDIENNHTTLKDIIDENKGKLIFIDFWASWCAPCISAFPSYKDLKKEFSKEKVLFLFISVDTDVLKWQQADDKFKLNRSFWAYNYGTSEFYKELYIKSFPRYLIFGKDGKLINSKAPGPDSDTIRFFLDEYLAN